MARRNPARVTKVHVTPAKAFDLLEMYEHTKGGTAMILPRNPSPAARQQWVSVFGKAWADIINAFANDGSAAGRVERARYFATEAEMIAQGIDRSEASRRASQMISSQTGFPVGVFADEARHVEKIASEIAAALKTTPKATSRGAIHLTAAEALDAMKDYVAAGGKFGWKSSLTTPGFVHKYGPVYARLINAYANEGRAAYDEQRVLVFPTHPEFKMLQAKFGRDVVRDELRLKEEHAAFPSEIAEIDNMVSTIATALKKV